MNFVFDTGSNQLWFPTTDCSTCQAGSIRYDTSSSDYYKKTSSEISEINYGRGHVEGFKSEDQVWFSDTDKIDKMPCLAVTAQRDLNGIAAEGILGLAPLDMDGQPPFLLDLMLQNGLIDQRILSFAYHLTNQQTQLVFGEPDYSMATSSSVNATIPIIAKGILYFVSILKSQIGGKTLFQSNKSGALIDTGTSLLQIPQEAYNNLVNFYRSQGANFLDCQEDVCASCGSISKESLIVTLATHKFNIPFSQLWINYSGVCYLGAFPSDSADWILGDVFIRSFFIVIDYDRAEITLIGDNISEVSKSIIGWVILGIVALIVIIFIGLCCFCNYRKKKKQQRQNSLQSGLLQNSQGVRLGSGYDSQRVNSSFQHEL